MRSNKQLQELARQVQMAAELETYLALDILPRNERASMADGIRKRLQMHLKKTAGTHQNSEKSQRIQTKASLRSMMLAEINQISLDLLRRAKKGFEAFQMARVSFQINTTNRGEPPEFSRFDFSEFPFVSFHGEALAAALRIREQRANQQLTALRFAHTRSEVRLFEMSVGHAEAYGHTLDREVYTRHREVLNRQTILGKSLPKAMHADVADFYACIEVGSIYPYALPIEIPMSATSDDLRFISETFKGLGTTLSISFELRIDGTEVERERAQRGRLAYEAAGIGLQVLAAWIMAIDVINDHPRCSICYRHRSAISRCSVHVTKKQETREARLGQRVRPHYEKRLYELTHMSAIRASLKADLPWTDEADKAMASAATSLGLSSLSCSRALVLANQLRWLVIVMNSEMTSQAGQLFQSILSIALDIESQPAPVGDEERRFRERQNQALKELMSLKGFFKAWCGKGRYSPEINLNMMGFDRDHPVTKGSALVSSMVSRTLLEQRAWSEAMQQFQYSNSPLASDINRLLKIKLTKQQVSDRLGIGLSTVYKILSRGVRHRRRQYLGRN